jgi:hypothetical protein
VLVLELDVVVGLGLVITQEQHPISPRRERIVRRGTQAT